MSVAARPFVIGGSALIASSLIAVTPVVAPPDLHRLTNTAVRLVDADSILNIPYNIIADIINIPYTESLALQEYAYALGPAGSEGGVAGWIPPGTADAGVDTINGQDYYTMGGTGSWWMESMGNTWGWDNGNWPQVDALLHFVLPLQWTEGLAASVQSVAQSAFIDGAQNANCEFQCSSVLGYLGGWLTHLGNVFSSTYPTTLTDTIGENSSTGIVNVGPAGFEDTAIWSGQPVTINPLLETVQAIWQNAIESPSSNPIMLPQDVLPNLALLGKDLLNDFNPFIEGSFVYWGADSLYSIPNLIGGLIHDVSLGLIPNEFLLPNNGAEPLTGYTDGPAQLLPNLETGFKYLMDGLGKYLDPSTYFAAASADASTAAAASADASTAAAASADASTLFGSLGDHAGLLADLSSAMPNLTTDLASMFPQLSAELSSSFPDLAAALIP